MAPEDTTSLPDEATAFIEQPIECFIEGLSEIEDPKEVQSILQAELDRTETRREKRVVILDKDGSPKRFRATRIRFRRAIEHRLEELKGLGSE